MAKDHYLSDEAACPRAAAVNAAVLETGRFQDCGPELVAVDRLHQEASEAGRPFPSSPRPVRDQSNSRHRPSQADVERPKLRQEFAPGPFGRLEVAHDDVGNECHSNRRGRGRRGDDRAGDLKHRPKIVSRRLVVMDHEHVNADQFPRAVTVDI
jgi:hypothetical protein